MKLLLTFFNPIFFILVESTIYSPLLQEQHGPLYEGVRLLIADEKLNAELVWNETVLALKETSNHLQQSIDQMHSYSSVIEERLKELNSINRPDNFGHCLQQYEREIAHFNRDLLRKHDVCMQTLEATVEHLEHETAAEIAFIQNATLEIQNVAAACRTAALRRSTSDQAGVTLCVVSRIGQIDQRLYDSAQLSLDVIAHIAVVNNDNSDDDDSIDSCQDFSDLKEQFDVVYYQITICIGNRTLI